MRRSSSFRCVALNPSAEGYWVSGFPCIYVQYHWSAASKLWEMTALHLEKGIAELVFPQSPCSDDSASELIVFVKWGLSLSQPALKGHCFLQSRLARSVLWAGTTLRSVKLDPGSKFLLSPWLALVKGISSPLVFTSYQKSQFLVGRGTRWMGNLCLACFCF